MVLAHLAMDATITSFVPLQGTYSTAKREGFWNGSSCGKEQKTFAGKFFLLAHQSSSSTSTPAAKLMLEWHYLQQVAPFLSLPVPHFCRSAFSRNGGTTFPWLGVRSAHFVSTRYSRYNFFKGRGVEKQ